VNLKHVSITDDKVVVIYEQETDNGSADVTFRCSDPPSKKFREAFESCGPAMSEALGLGDYVAGEEVTKIAIKEGDEKTEFVVTAKHPIEDSNRPLNISTPLLDDEAFPELGECVKSVMRCARAYVSGDRAQLLLFGKEAA